MSFMQQLFEEPIEIQQPKTEDLGTFKDNSRAPVHRWFQYPAGYSYKFVDLMFEKYSVKQGDWIYDPFSGTGTTLIGAKLHGFNGYGVEAHAFVHWVAQVKLYWGYDLPALHRSLEIILSRIYTVITQQINDVDISDIFPDLVYKCYHTEDLKVLYLIREFIVQEVSDPHLQDLLKLALTNTLRTAAAAGTGWPYIAPRKNTGNKPPKNAYKLFQQSVYRMYDDLQAIANYRNMPGEIHNVLGDSRHTQPLADNRITLAITSPPYLNNYDYADRTRLETYFWGITKSWREITEKYRNKLMTAATTQIVRSHHIVETTLNEELKLISQPAYQKIQDAALQLSELRKQKGGKKDYDLMVALYFNDMLRVLQETHRLLKPSGKLCLVLGDSAPYGVHVPTDELIGQIGVGLGFAGCEYRELRSRGGKWKENPQRHTVKLREGIVTLTK
jgi:DNA modification methylase